MKLTEQQLAQVELYLATKNIEYIDLYFEVLDHISSDIENLMLQNELTFEDAFISVKLKWKESFALKSSLWLGLMHDGSKLFIDNCVKIYRPLAIKSVVFILVSLSLFYGSIHFFEMDLNNFKDTVNKTYALFVILNVSFVLFWHFQLKKTTIKSSYSYLFNKKIFLGIFFLVFILFDKNKSINNLKILYGFIVIPDFFIGYYLFKQHLKIVSNYIKI